MQPDLYVISHKMLFFFISLTSAVQVIHFVINQSQKFKCQPIHLKVNTKCVTNSDSHSSHSTCYPTVSVSIVGFMLNV
jgi:phosphoribosylformylglycinamidine (FGAM) synthase-like amidotransferase family enzyme